jgi:hypothetical protein
VVFPFEPTDEAWTIETPEGSGVIWFPAPGIAAARLRGVATGELARRAYELTDLQAPTPLLGFLDMYETTGFEWEARGRALRWNITHLSPKMMLHILVRTPPLVLAMKVFRRALEEHVEIHTEPAPFASAYNLAVKRRARATSTYPPAR